MIIKARINKNQKKKENETKVNNNNNNNKEIKLKKIRMIISKTNRHKKIKERKSLGRKEFKFLCFSLLLETSKLFNSREKESESERGKKINKTSN